MTDFVLRGRLLTGDLDQQGEVCVYIGDME